MIFPHGDVYCEKYLSYLISNQQTLLLTLKIKHIPSALLIKSAKHRKGVKCVIMWGFHWGMCFYSQSGDKSFSFFFKSNWKHNAAVGWTHRSSSVSVITPNNVQSCQAPLSLSRCLSPLKPSQISFVWMCNYFVARRMKKNNWHPAICLLVGGSEHQRAGFVSAACIVAKHPQIHWHFVVGPPPPPRQHMWVSSASGNKRRFVRNASAR